MDAGDSNHSATLVADTAAAPAVVAAASKESACRGRSSVGKRTSREGVSPEGLSVNGGSSSASEEDMDDHPTRLHSDVDDGSDEEKPLKVHKTEESPTAAVVAGSSLDDEGEAEEEEEESLIPARPSLNTSAAVVAAAAAVATAAPQPQHRPFRFPRVAAPPPRRRGAYTVLRSIAQLAQLVEGGASSAASRYVPAETAAETDCGATTTTSSSSSAAVAASAVPTLCRGESVVILLHRGRGGMDEFVNGFTMFMSHVRLFSLDLAALPAHEYEEEESPAEGGGEDATSPLSAAAADGRSGPVAGDDTVEETPLFVAGPAAPDTQQQQLRQRGGVRHTTAVAAAAATDDAPLPLPVQPQQSAKMSLAAATYMTGELSEELNHVAEVVLEKVRRVLRTDTLLTPNYFQGEAGGSAKTEPLVLPAMVLWRAGGGAQADYSPYLPCSYSDGSTPSLSQQQQQFSDFSQAFSHALHNTQQSVSRRGTQQQQQQLTTGTDAVHSGRYRHFGDYLRAHGGPLVVKQLNSNDQVHSLSLYAPVYTVAHMYKHMVESAKRALLRKYGKEGHPDYTYTSSFTPLGSSAAAAENAARAGNFFRLLDREGAKSRTLLYLGASWCPPCMRIVGDMPLFVKDNFVLDDHVMAQFEAAPAAPSSSSSVEGPGEARRGASAANPTTANAGKNLHVFLKADMDLAKPIFDLLSISIIPTFVIFDNTKLFALERRFFSQQQQEQQPQPLDEAAMAEVVSAAEISRLQNSQRHLINVFVEKNCTTLSFDEDF